MYVHIFIVCVAKYILIRRLPRSCPGLATRYWICRRTGGAASTGAPAEDPWTGDLSGRRIRRYRITQVGWSADKVSFRFEGPLTCGHSGWDQKIVDHSGWGVIKWRLTQVGGTIEKGITRFEDQ